MECIKQNTIFSNNTTKKIFILFVLSCNLFTCSSSEDNAETVQTAKALAKFKTSINDKPFEYSSLIKRQKKESHNSSLFNSFKY